MSDFRFSHLLSYKNPVRTSQETHYVSTTEPNRLMLCGEAVTVCCEDRTEHTDAVRTSQETHHVSLQSPTGYCCVGKQSLFAVRTVRNTQMQSVPHRRHITSPLQSPTGYCCVGKQSLFAVRTVRNTQIHCVGGMRSFWLLKYMVRISTTTV
jgi:hypothetical protein